MEIFCVTPRKELDAAMALVVFGIIKICSNATPRRSSYSHTDGNLDGKVYRCVFFLASLTKSVAR
jgi:hypothetical protein